MNTLSQNYVNTGNPTAKNKRCSSSKGERIALGISLAIIAVFVVFFGMLMYKQHNKNISAKCAIADELGISYLHENINRDMSALRDNIGYWGENTYSITVWYQGNVVYHYIPEQAANTMDTDSYNKVIDDAVSKINGSILLKAIEEFILFE